MSRNIFFPCVAWVIGLLSDFFQKKKATPDKSDRLLIGYAVSRTALVSKFSLQVYKKGLNGSFFVFIDFLE